MLDLETLDTGSHAAILSIGVVEFGPEGLGREFYTAVKTQNQKKNWGRTISESTLTWWGQQSAEAQKVFVDPAALELDVALSVLSEWAKPAGKFELWGNGSDFDNIILGNAYEACGMPKPWSYSKNRCFRTLKNLGIGLQAGEGVNRAETGTHHNALDDAKYQALYAIAYLGKLAA